MEPARQGQKKDIKTTDGQMNRTREGGGGQWKLLRENAKAFLNVTLRMIPDSVNQMFSPPLPGRSHDPPPWPYIGASRSLLR